MAGLAQDQMKISTSSSTSDGQKNVQSSPVQNTIFGTATNGAWTLEYEQKANVVQR
jgi:hypothetical protein